MSENRTLSIHLEGRALLKARVTGHDVRGRLKLRDILTGASLSTANSFASILDAEAAEGIASGAPQHVVIFLGRRHDLLLRPVPRDPLRRAEIVDRLGVSHDAGEVSLDALLAPEPA